jgi:hypothetical protein
MLINKREMIILQQDIQNERKAEKERKIQSINECTKIQLFENDEKHRRTTRTGSMQLKEENMLKK